MIPNAPPLQTIGLDIDDLYDEAKNHLDGKPIETEGQAEAVATLLDRIRKARRAADDQRATEKRPHDDAAKAIQAAWKPLLDKCDLAADTCKKALTPWQLKLEEEQRQRANEARAAAEKAQREAQAALAASRGDDLTARAEAEAKLKDADKASKLAGKLDRAKPQVAGADRAIGLRTAYRTEVTDMTAFARWAWANRREEYEAFLTDLAEREGRRGPVQIPGLIVHTIRSAA